MTGGRRTGEDIQLDFICCSDPRVRQLEERLLMGSALLLQRDECSKAIRKWLENGEKRVRVRNKQTNKQLNTPRTMAVGSRPYPWASTSIPAPSAA